MTTVGREPAESAIASMVSRLGSVHDAAVGKSEVLARRKSEHRCRARRFLGREARRAARAQLSGREIDDSGRASERRRLDQRAAARELDIVPVRGDRKNITVVIGRI